MSQPRVWGSADLVIGGQAGYPGAGVQVAILERRVILAGVVGPGQRRPVARSRKVVSCSEVPRKVIGFTSSCLKCAQLRVLPVVYARVEGGVGCGGGGNVGCLLHVEGGGVWRPGVPGQRPTGHVGGRCGVGVAGETAGVTVDIM